MWQRGIRDGNKDGKHKARERENLPYSRSLLRNSMLPPPLLANAARCKLCSCIGISYLSSHSRFEVLHFKRVIHIFGLLEGPFTKLLFVGQKELVKLGSSSCIERRLERDCVASLIAGLEAI